MVQVPVDQWEPGCKEVSYSQIPPNSMTGAEMPEANSVRRIIPQASTCMLYHSSDAQLE